MKKGRSFLCPSSFYVAARAFALCKNYLVRRSRVQKSKFIIKRRWWIYWEFSMTSLNYCSGLQKVVGNEHVNNRIYSSKCTTAIPSGCNAAQGSSRGTCGGANLGTYLVIFCVLGRVGASHSDSTDSTRLFMLDSLD